MTNTVTPVPDKTWEPVRWVCCGKNLIAAWLPATCPTCGLTYDQVKTKLKVEAI